jgi:hypothetical protein
LGDPLKGNLLLFYKPLHLEAQQVSTRIEVRRHQASEEDMRSSRLAIKASQNYEPVTERAMKIRGLRDVLGGCTATLQKQSNVVAWSSPKGSKTLGAPKANGQHQRSSARCPSLPHLHNQQGEGKAHKSHQINGFIALLSLTSTTSKGSKNFVA